jgi:hypothetical protein
MFSRKKTVASVLSSFNEILSDLDEVAEHNRAIATANHLKIVQLELESYEAGEEARAADKIREKIADLVSG